MKDTATTKKTRRGRKTSAPKRHSSFWDGDVLTTKGVEKSSQEYIMRLAAHRRALANFVTILTGQQIPVVFPERGESYTDGKKVTIGAEATEQGFDSTVGLALHEASHVVYSDFGLLRSIMNSYPDQLLGQATARVLDNKGFTTQAVRNTLKNLWNYVEDRWIDHLTYTAAPGYRPYYRALYARYWESKEIDELIASPAFRDESLSAYLTRIINLTNANTDLSALAGLREIWQVLDLANIGRIQSSKDSLAVAVQIFEVISRFVAPMTNADANASEKGGEVSEGDFEGDSEPGEGGSGDSESEDKGSSGSAGDSAGGDEADEDEDEDGEGAGSDDSDSDDEDDDADGSGDSDSDSDDGDENDTPSASKIKKMNKALKGQKQMLDGNISKKTVSKDVSKKIEVIEEAGTQLSEVGGQNTEKGQVPKINVYVIKKVTDSLISSEMFPFVRKVSTWYNADTVTFGSSQIAVNHEAKRGVEDGLAAGRTLVKKLVVRNEEKSTKFSRLDKGRLDKRLIHQLGFTSDGIFEQTVKTVYSDAILHISIDASGSMQGDKWYQAIKVASALAFAATKIEGLDVRVDLRGSISSSAGSGRTWHNNTSAYVAIVFDSRVDGISKVKRMFPVFQSNSATPEALCFEAIMGLMVEGNNSRDSYFLNLSDGEPAFQGYSWEVAYAHTRMMVRELKKKGIKVLSYFIGDSGYSSGDGFRQMYGKDARFVDVNNVFQIAKTMNQMFLSNGKRDV